MALRIPEDAQELLANGLATYRREHKNMPARLVIHKTSYFNENEKEGFKRAAEEEKLEVLDLVTVRRSGARVPPSMSRKGNCYDNAVAESFFSTLKNELIHHQLYHTREEASREIFAFIEGFYN